MVTTTPPAPAPVPVPTPAPTPTPDPTSTPTIWSSFVAVLVELAGSAKFQVLIASVVTWIVLKLGWHVDQAQIDRLLALAGTYLMAQGVADHGKARALVEAQTQVRLALMQHAANSNVDLPRVVAAARSTRAGVIRPAVMAVVAAIGMMGGSTLAYLTACGSKTGQVVLAAGQCVLDSGALTELYGDLGQDNYAQLVADLVTKLGPTLVGCALSAIAAGQQPTPTATDAGVAQVLTYDAVRVGRANELIVKYKSRQ